MNSLRRPADGPDSRARTLIASDVVGRRDDLALAVDRRQHIAAIVRHGQLDDVGQRTEAVGEGAAAVVEPFPGDGADRHRAGMVGDQLLGGQRRQVGLVEHDQLGHALGADLAEHRAHGVDLAGRIGGAGVDDVDQVVGVGGHLERALERLDEAVGKAPHEADGVGEQHRLATGQRQASRRRVERGEQAVLREHAGIGEGVEQRRLAGVGVADDRDRGQPTALALLALEVAGAVELLEVAIELADPPQDAPAVDLEPRLAAAEAHADAAALLGEPGRRAAAQSGQAIAQQGQLDLRATFERVGVLGEDVEDHRRAVDRRAAEQALQVVLLGRGQLVVEHDGVGVDGEAQLAQFLGLALADEPRAIGDVAALRDRVPTSSAPAVSTRAASSSRLASASSSVTPGKATPTRTMRSRNARSMSVAPSASEYGVLVIGLGTRSWRCRWSGR